MNVSLAPVSVGAPGSPLDVTSSLPGFLGGLDGTPSYYQITGLSTFTAYRVQLGNLTANVDLDVYSDVNFTASLCSAAQSSVAETCEATTPGTGELYVKVTNAAGSTDVAFILDVMAPVVDEGPSGTPIDLTNLLPYSGQIKTTASYYVVHGLVPNFGYSVELIDRVGQGSLEVISDAPFSISLWTSDLGGNWPESCTDNSNGSGSLCFQGLPGGGFSTTGANYTVKIQ